MRHAFPALIVFVSVVFTSVSASAGIKAGKAGDMTGRTKLNIRNPQPRLLKIKPSTAVFRLKGNLRGGRTWAPAAGALIESHRRVARLPQVSHPARLKIATTSTMKRITGRVIAPATAGADVANGAKLPSPRQ